MARSKLGWHERMPKAKLLSGRQTLTLPEKGKGKGKQGSGVAGSAAAAAVEANPGELRDREQGQGHDQDDSRPRKRAVVRTPRKQKVGRRAPQYIASRNTQKTEGVHGVGADMRRGLRPCIVSKQFAARGKAIRAAQGAPTPVRKLHEVGWRTRCIDAGAKTATSLAIWRRLH